jgi:diacylglycerol kinase (ATP)
LWVKGRPLHERLGFAFSGLRTGFRRERSFRTHCAVAVAALFALIVLHPAPVWWALFAVIAALVFAFELLNSVIETMFDLLHPEVHPEIKAAKDMASGAVLVIGLAALAVAVALIVARAPELLHEWGWMR